MERARPTRSGIPMFVASNEERSDFQGQTSNDGVPYPPGTVDGYTNYQSAIRKEKPIHFPARSQRKHNLNSNGRLENGSTRTHLHNDYDTPSGSRRSNSEYTGSVYGTSSGDCLTSRHRQPTRRPLAVCSQIKRNGTHSLQHEPAERSVVGCESPPALSSIPSQVESGKSWDSDKRTDVRQHEMCHAVSKDVGATTHEQCHSNENSQVSREAPLNESVVRYSDAETDARSPNAEAPMPSDNASLDASTILEATDKCDCEDSNTKDTSDDIRNNVVNSFVDNYTTTTSPPVSVMDYPIRGTMHPLTNKVAVKRSVGPVDEVSFVFGRPASPTSEQAINCNSPKAYTNPGIVRCMSPSPIRYIPGPYLSRPMSPNSDILPARRIMPGSDFPDRRVLSPPPLLGLGSAAESRIHHQGGICCEHCNGCLVELKRQALRLMFPDNGFGRHLVQGIPLDNIGERLTMPEGYERWYSRTGQCGVCETPLEQLKQEAVSMIQSIQLAQTSAMSANLPSLVGSCSFLPQQRPRYNSRYKPHSPYASSSEVLSPSSSFSSNSSIPLAAQAQAYLEQNVRAYINPQKYSQMLANRTSGNVLYSPYQDSHYEAQSCSDASRTPLSSCRPPAGQKQQQYYQKLQHHWPGYAHPVSATHTFEPNHVSFRGGTSASPMSSPLSPPPVPSAAVSFFARAAQKLGKKKKRHHSQDQEPQPSFPTNFAEIIRLSPPPAPPCLLRTVGRLQNPGMGKVKVMLKICNPVGSQGEQGVSFLSADPRKKQVTVFDPSASGYVTSASRRTAVAVPKMFAFDSVVTPDDSLTELCASSLAEIVQAVVAGADGCVFTYGYSKLGKTYTMIGSDHSSSTLGVMACAIAWLFKLINEQKDKTGARFSVRVSAVQVTGKEEVLRDLLSDIAQAGAEATGVGTAPGVYLREDPICGTQLENQSELRAPTADKAAFYLDAALAARVTGEDDDARASHLLFTLNVYQYRIEKANTKAGLPGVAGGRSRLHLIDLGTSSRSKDPNNVSLSLSALGNVIMALLNGQRHVPHRDSKIAQLLRDSLGNLSCRTCMIAHVSSAVPHYNETLQVIQLAARIHRMKRRRTKFSSTSSEDSSTDGDVKFRRPYRGLRMGTLREDVLYTSSHSDPDYTSSSEQSCDTVIYIGANGQSLSDRELTDNEGPPRHVPRTNPRLPRRPSGSRSSGDDSDSGRSMHSVRSLDSRLPSQSLMSHIGSVALSKLGHPSSIPGSPNPGLVKMGHIVGVYGKVSAAGDGQAVDCGGNAILEQWQDKSAKIHSHSLQSKMAKAIHEKQLPLDGELWIDGPGASVSSEPKASELWVDGPQAFVVHQQPQSLTSSSSSSRDGQHHQQPHHRSDSRNGATKKVDAEEQWVDGPKEMLVGSSQAQPMHTYSKGEHTSRSSTQPRTCMPNKLNEKALKQALVKHMESVSRHDSDVLNHDYASIQETDSLSASYQNSDNLLDLSGQNRNKSDCSNLVTSVKHVDASSSPIVSTKAQKLSESPKKTRSCTQSPKLSPTPSPSVSKKYSKIESPHASRLQKSQIPTSSPSPTHRVVQWIKSVSSEQELAAGIEPRKHDSCGHQLLLSSDSVLMADAETNTEHDSDFERLAEENQTKSESDEDAEMRSLNTAVYCEAFKSSFDSNLDTAAINRESIYELEVEKHLELIKTKDGSRLAAEVDNDTFSSVSCSNRDADELDHCAGDMESLLIQHTKALTESKQTTQLARHLAQSHHARNISPAGCEHDAEALELSRPLLSRKPDGASNPNLQQIFNEEDSINKINFHSLPGSSEKSMFVCACHDDSTTSLPATSSKPYATHVDDKNCCHNDINIQSPYGREDFSKQPLLSRSSPTQKHIELPKHCTDCQSCTDSSRSCSIYCVAKPTHITKDSLGSQPKLSLSGKKSYVPLSSPTARNKFASSDKASCSSSSTTHSPQSSATSSPLISTTSKSSTASLVHKASFKSRNGSVTKLPTISSSRTSSPSAKDSKARKKDKEKGSSSHANLLSEIFHKGKGNDSDSGNDSGIVAHEKRLLSPYATVTKPRTPSHSSSGHGSDNSTISTDVHPDNSRNCTLAENIHGGTSSGYESMMRDSEATGSSSGHDDSSSESSSEHKKGSKHKGKRSRSAPARSLESSTVSSQPSQAGSKSAGHNHQIWVDTRHLHKVKDEPLELKKYDPDEVERLGRRRIEDEGKFSTESKQKSNATKVEEDNRELTASHDRIELEQNGWSFDCRLFMCFSCKSQQRGTDV